MNTSTIPRYNLKQYTRVFIAFFVALVVLSIYQYTTLYFKGILDSVLTISFVQAIIHHIGYTSLVALLLVPIFNFFENWRPRIGFKIVSGILVLLLIIETLLISYFCTAFVPLEAGLLKYPDIFNSLTSSGGKSLFTLIFILIVTVLFHFIYRLTRKNYHYIGKMYPFTIILFTLFIATLFIPGKPINENKTQYLITSLAKSNINTADDVVTNSPSEINKPEMVWLNSVYNGKDSDKGYITARNLAVNKEFDRALLLCKYILSDVPSHIDTKILTGRIKAWSGDYKQSTVILHGCIKTNPTYADSYAALLDVSFWSDNVKLSNEVLELIKANKIDISAFEDKVLRAKNKEVNKIAAENIATAITNIKNE